MRLGLIVVLGLASLGMSACSLFTVQQDPFQPMQISAKRPDPPPARVVLTDSSISILDKVQFKVGSAELLEVSFPLLNEVANMMKENPQLEIIQVEGHTSSEGGVAVNKKLSQARAESVRKYIISQGIAAKRLVAKGFGPERPIADNATDAGKEQNRRVEFNIIKQGPKKTLVQDE